MPPEAVAGFSQGGSSLNLTGTDLRATILAQFPQAAPIVDAIVAGIREAISVSLAGAIWIGIGAAIIAVIAVLFLKEVPLTTNWGDEGPPPAAMG